MRRPPLPAGARVWRRRARGVKPVAIGGRRAVEAGVASEKNPDAWIALPGEAEVRAVLPPGARERALCEIAEKLSATPTRMVEEDWRPLRALGFDDRACLEVAHVVGIFNYLTRLADGLGLQLDAATRAAAESGVPLKRPG